MTAALPPEAAGKSVEIWFAEKLVSASRGR